MSEPTPSRGKLGTWLVVIAAVGALAGLTVWAWPWLGPILHDPQSIRNWLQGFGLWSPVVFVALQVLQVVVFVLPGEVTQIAGGWLFGLGLGSVLSLVGIAIGSSLAFGLTRWLGVGFVHRIAGPETVAKFDSLMASPRFIGSLFLFFLIPGIPKDVLCYVAGLSRLKFIPFLAISCLARLPGILGSSLMGRALFHGDWVVLAAVAGGALVLFGLGWLFRETIFALVERFAVAPERPKDPPDEPR